MKRSAPLSRGVGPKRTTSLSRSAKKNSTRTTFTPASKEQRAKVRELACVVCGKDIFEQTIHPAHLTPRSKGGCDAAECVIALCAYDHRRFDDGELDLLSVLTASWPAYRPEVAHMLEHLNPVELLEQLANDRVQWRAVGFVPEEATQ
jgi:hypothetical protein